MEFSGCVSLYRWEQSRHLSDESKAEVQSVLRQPGPRTESFQLALRQAGRRRMLSVSEREQKAGADVMETPPHRARRRSNQPMVTVSLTKVTPVPSPGEPKSLPALPRPVPF